MLEDQMDMPPYWMGIQLAIANGEGMVPMNNKDTFLHFCSVECLAEYADQDLREMVLVVDQKTDKEDGMPDFPEEL